MDLNKRSLSSVCPVSDVLDLSSYYGYPIDIFDTSLMKKIDVTSRKSLLDCTTPISGTETLHYNCSTSLKACPMSEERVDLITNSQSKSASVVCRFFHNLKKTNNPMRLVAYGGSVTVGSMTEGGVRGDVKERRPWLAYLGEWVNSTYPNRVKRYNLGYAAHNSYRYQDIVLEYTKKNGIKEYNSNDLILFDFAMNDNICNIAAEYHQLKIGVESMVRKIYLISDPKDPPAVILLDGVGVAPSVGACSGKYITIYKNVSDHYGIPLWSYREAVNLMSYTTANEIVYEPYVKWNQSILHTDHPPWFVHLFTADLYARVLLKQFEKCDASLVAPWKLPPPLYSDTEMHCDARHPMLLNVDYDDIHAGRSGDVIGSYESVPAGAWQIREDVKGKGGFVRELNNSTDHAFDARLVFRLNTNGLSVEDLVQLNWHLKVEYLRTYINAGYADAYFCGKRVLFQLAHRRTGLDSLWVDYEHFKYSLPSVLVHQLEINGCLVKHANGSVSHLIPPVLEIIHRDATNVTSVNLPKLRRPAKVGESYVSDGVVRGNQKVKIISVSICSTLPTSYYHA